MASIKQLFNSKTAIVFLVLLLALWAFLYRSVSVSDDEDNIVESRVKDTEFFNVYPPDQNHITATLGLSNTSGRAIEEVPENKQQPHNQAIENALQELKSPPPTIEQVKKQSTNHSHPNPEVFKPERAERNAKIVAPKDAARDGDWDEFLKAALELQTLSDYMFDNSLLSAIRYDAPPHIFKELLARGARFNALHLGVLVRSDKVSMIQMLMGLGLDIHMTAPNGDNAVNFVLETMSAREMIKFLLYHGVEVQNGSKIHDPLMFTLLKAEKDQEAVYFAYQLIRFGAQPGSEHLRQAQKLQSVNPGAFQLIQKNVPELTSS